MRGYQENHRAFRFCRKSAVEGKTYAARQHHGNRYDGGIRGKFHSGGRRVRVCDCGDVCFAADIEDSAIFGYIGIRIQAEAPEQLLRKILGSCLILLSVRMMRKRTQRKPRSLPAAGLAAGMMSGIMGGMMSIGGPPMVLYFLGVTDSKEEYTATLQMYFFLSTLYLFFTHLLMGHLTKEVWIFSLFALLGLGAGTAAGMAVFQRIRQETFRKVVYVFMIFAGIYMLFT